MDSARVTAAVAFAVASESRAPRDLLLAHVQSFGREPFGDAVVRSTSVAIRPG